MRRFLTVALAGSTLALGACDGGTGPDGPARVTVMLTDAPGDVLNAWVEIREVYLQGGPDGRTVLESFDPAEVVELTGLANRATELVSETEIPEGSYAELRFVLGDACIEVETADGSTFYASDLELCPPGTATAGALQMPSLGNSGLKVKFDEPLEFAGGETALLVDFDVAESFGKQAGNSGKWVMHPVIRGGTMGEAGSVTVTFVPGSCTEAGFEAELVAKDAEKGEKKAFPATAPLTVEYKYVLTGDYTVKLVVPEGVTTDPATVAPVPVTVTAGGSAAAQLTLTSCSKAP